jgi:hypothetical protein
MEQRAERGQLELIWRGAASYGSCADVFTHNYHTGNYGPPNDTFFFEYNHPASQTTLIIVRNCPACPAAPNLQTGSCSASTDQALVLCLMLPLPIALACVS